MKRIFKGGLAACALAAMQQAAMAASICIVNNTTHPIDVQYKGKELARLQAMTTKMVSSEKSVHVIAAECPGLGWGCTIGKDETLVIHPSHKPTKENGVAQCM